MAEIFKDSGISGAYADNEKIDFEGMTTSLQEIIKRVGEGSELEKEINKVDELATQLTVAWKSAESHAAKNKIDEVNAELVTVRADLNRLLEEITRYSNAANEINTGTMKNTD